MFLSASLHYTYTYFANFSRPFVGYMRMGPDAFPADYEPFLRSILPILMNEIGKGSFHLAT